VSPTVQVRAATPEDQSIVHAFLDEHATTRVARLGELLDAREHSALLGEDGRRLVGVLTYTVDGERCEILTLHVAEPWSGIGSALLDELEGMAVAVGCRRLWLITTNDNVDALRFYQRRGFRLAALHAGAVARSRGSLKPEIPETGEYGIPIHDELELHKEL
jgi:ribosomal protein S18 acetylase RimI-like enzyme